MMTGGPRPGCAAAAPGPGCSRQAGRQVLGGGVAEKAAASLGMGGEYSHILPRTLPGYRKTWRRVLWNPGRKLSGAYSWLSKFQVFIGLALNGSCVILKIGKQYDHDDGGAFDALQEEKGRPEGLLKHGRHVAGPGHTRRLPKCRSDCAVKACAAHGPAGESVCQQIRSVARVVRGWLAKLRPAATSRGIDTSTLRQNMQYGLSMVEKAV